MYFNKIIFTFIFIIILVLISIFIFIFKFPFARNLFTPPPHLKQTNYVHLGPTFILGFCIPGPPALSALLFGQTTQALSKGLIAKYAANHNIYAHKNNTLGSFFANTFMYFCCRYQCFNDHYNNFQCYIKRLF